MSEQTAPTPIEGELLSAYLGTRTVITRVAATGGYGNPDQIGRVNKLIASTEGDYEFVSDVKFVTVGEDAELIAIVVYATSEAIEDEIP